MNIFTAVLTFGKQALWAGCVFVCRRYSFHSNDIVRLFIKRRFTSSSRPVLPNKYTLSQKFDNYIFDLMWENYSISSNIC